MPYSTPPQAIDRAADAERGAYNQAFAELGLEWYWDERTYRELRACAGDKHCIHAYIEANHRTCCRRTTAARSPTRSIASASA
jgi:predicted mannosyl-3-phosphoglycerate phosphatase (HAD superfamily)